MVAGDEECAHVPSVFAIQCARIAATPSVPGDRPHCCCIMLVAVSDIPTHTTSGCDCFGDAKSESISVFKISINSLW